MSEGLKAEKGKASIEKPTYPKQTYKPQNKTKIKSKFN
jgi:hypothetical protein